MPTKPKMSAPRGKSVDVLLHEAGRLKDPVERLKRLADARTQIGRTGSRLHADIQGAIVAARDADTPATWPEIGAILGVSAQRAQQLARPVPVVAE